MTVLGWQRDLVAPAPLAAMVQSLQDAIIGKDLNGIIFSWNPGAERLYDYRPLEVFGPAHRPADSGARSKSRVNDADPDRDRREGEPFRTRRVHKNGTDLKISVSAWSIVDVNNAIIGVTAASRDVGDLAVAQAWSQTLLEAAPDVLYVEDNNPNVHVMEQLEGRLSRWRLITPGNGSLGVELATGNPPDLVLLDLNLPDIDGVQVLQRLKALPGMSRTRVIVVSADANPQQIQKLIKEGADGYMTKPLVLRKFFEALDAAATTAGTV
jgi:PAS domain S-box-containing protein